MTILPLVAILALAQPEPACRRAGAEVVCSTAGFQTLTDLLVDARAEATKCRLRLSASEAQVTALERALADIKAQPVPTAPSVAPSVPAPTARPLVAVVAGVIGAAAATTAVAADLSPEARLGLGLTGLIGLSVGFVAAFPFP